MIILRNKEFSNTTENENNEIYSKEDKKYFDKVNSNKDTNKIARPLGYAMAGIGMGGFAGNCLKSNAQDLYIASLLKKYPNSYFDFANGCLVGIGSGEAGKVLNVLKKAVPVGATIGALSGAYLGKKEYDRKEKLAKSRIERYLKADEEERKKLRKRLTFNEKSILFSLSEEDKDFIKNVKDVEKKEKEDAIINGISQTSWLSSCGNVAGGMYAYLRSGKIYNDFMRKNLDPISANEFTNPANIGSIYNRLGKGDANLGASILNSLNNKARKEVGNTIIKGSLAGGALGLASGTIYYGNKYNSVKKRAEEKVKKYMKAKNEATKERLRKKVERELN